MPRLGLPKARPNRPPISSKGGDLGFSMSTDTCIEGVTMREKPERINKKQSIVLTPRYCERSDYLNSFSVSRTRVMCRRVRNLS